MQRIPWKEELWIQHTRVILDAFTHWTGGELCSRAGSAEDQARRLFEAPFIVVAHGTQNDPILNYGNQAALDLWELDLETFLKTPSRKTAEPMHRDERAKMLQQSHNHGYISDYQGIRITSTGKRFYIRRATVWSLKDSTNQPLGQAATFSEWEMLS